MLIAGSLARGGLLDRGPGARSSILGQGAGLATRATAGAASGASASSSCSGFGGFTGRRRGPKITDRSEISVYRARALSGLDSVGIRHYLSIMDSVTKMALLQALVAKPGYGLELVERVKTRTKGKIALRNGSVYPTLRDLERDGLVESYEVDEALEERGGRPRRYYRLTAIGAKVALEDRKVMAGLFNLARATR